MLRPAIVPSLATIFFLSLPVCLSGAEGDWLARHLPPVFERGTPFTIQKIEISRNHVGQEIVKAEYQRTPEVIQILAEEIKLVILPVGGGRHEVGANAGIAISPRQSGAISGITDSLIDYRGKIPGGARAYIEMSPASVAKKQPPVRISNIFWVGSQEQLKAAQKKDPADPDDAELRSFVVQQVADDMEIPAGMPIRFAGGTHWFRGTVLEKSIAGQPLKLLVYFARPSELYLPWYVTADRSDLKVETAALAAAKTDAAWFKDHLREIKGLVTQGSAPFTLKAAGEKVKQGDRIVWFGFHGLMGGEALSDATDGQVKVRDNRFMQEMMLEVGQLFVDPSPPTN